MVRHQWQDIYGQMTFFNSKLLSPVEHLNNCCTGLWRRTLFYRVANSLSWCLMDESGFWPSGQCLYFPSVLVPLKQKNIFFPLNSVSVGVWWPQWPESTLRWLVAFGVKEQQQLEQGADCWRWVSDLSVSPSKFDVFSHGCQKFELILQIRAGYPKISCRTYSIFPFLWWRQEDTSQWCAKTWLSLHCKTWDFRRVQKPCTEVNVITERTRCNTLKTFT